MRNISVMILFRIWTSGSGDVVNNHFSSGALETPSFSGTEPFVQFWTFKEQFSEIILNFDQRFRRICHSKIFHM